MHQIIKIHIFAILLAAMILYAGSTEEKPLRFSPDINLEILRDGNARFHGWQMLHPNLGRRRIEQTSKGQNSYATMLTCSDSRVPVEHIFDAGIGMIGNNSVKNIVTRKIIKRKLYYD